MTLLTDGFPKYFSVLGVLVNNPLSLSDCFLLDMVLNAMEQNLVMSRLILSFLLTLCSKSFYSSCSFLTQHGPSFALGANVIYLAHGT